MVKIEKNDIINIITGAFLSALFTWMFSILTESLDPIIILYTILSTLGVLTFFHIIKKLLIVIYNKGSFWLKINRYNKKVDQIAEIFKNEMIKKEIFIVSTREFGKYLDPKIRFYKPSRASVDFFNAGALKKSTLDVINGMINLGFLIYIESNELLLLKEKMICIECGGEILFEDKIDSVDIKCQGCTMEYRIIHDGLWYVEKEHKNIKLYIRIKHLDRLRF